MLGGMFGPETPPIGWNRRPTLLLKVSDGVRRHIQESMSASSAQMSKAPVSFSERAVGEIRKIMTTKDIPKGFNLRVGVRGGGCSGMSYILGFDRMREHDVCFEFDGITVYMDKRHGLYLMGSTVDYHDGLSARGFTFDNPNATQRCGCGSSFAA